MKLFSVLALALILTSCNEVDGNLRVDSLLNLKSKNAEFQLEVGDYRASVDFKSKKKIEIEIATGEDKETALVLLKREVKIPSNNGSFHIRAQDNNQNLDIDGEVRTEVVHGRRMRDQESCTYTVYRRRCRQDRNGRRSCYDEPIQRRGWQTVEYHYDEIDRDYDIAMSSGNNLVASFTAHEHSSRRVEDYRSNCR